MTSQTTSLSPTLQRLGGWGARLGIGRRLPVILWMGASLSGLVTYAAFTGWGPLGPDPTTIFVLLNIDLVLVLLLSAVVLRRLVQLWLERRRGSAGSRLHVRIVALFGFVSVAPAILIAVFSLVAFHLGLQAWFSERVRVALDASLKVAEAYLDEHRQLIRADALAMANDLNRTGPALLDNPALFNRFLATQAALRSLTEAMVFTRDGRVLGRTGLTFSLLFGPPPFEAMEKADGGEAVILTSQSDDRVRALVRLASFVDSYLFVGRFVDSRVLAHMERVQKATAEYRRLEGQRSRIQITFTLIFAVVSLLLLLVAVCMGLTFATRLVRPIGGLIAAAERVRSGDLEVRVDEAASDDEVSSLSRAFNRMTERIGNQQGELLEANRQIDARRRFTESVLLGVSAGVIGLDAQGRVEIANRSALELLGVGADALIAKPLAATVPEMEPLIARAMRRPERRVESEVTMHRGGRTLSLMVRIGAERLGGALEGFVVTFDDITALVTAQRKAAWADVARRIAHEIKNPLTPIQLSAERLQRKYRKEIKSDPETFTTCTETIIRQVRDIGRLVDEFSAFARMPAPEFRDQNLVTLVTEVVAAQRIAHPGIDFVAELPDRVLVVRCDAHQISQVLTNLLNNAVDAITERGKEAPHGRITVALGDTAGRAEITVTDNGRGLPDLPVERLLEPYVTTRTKGTGLGLAIVRKIVEDHGGSLSLANRPEGGARIRVTLPLAEAAVAPSASQHEGTADGP